MNRMGAFEHNIFKTNIFILERSMYYVTDKLSTTNFLSVPVAFD